MKKQILGFILIFALFSCIQTSQRNIFGKKNLPETTHTNKNRIIKFLSTKKLFEEISLSTTSSYGAYRNTDKLTTLYNNNSISILNNTFLAKFGLESQNYTFHSHIDKSNETIYSLQSQGSSLKLFSYSRKNNTLAEFELMNFSQNFAYALFLRGDQNNSIGLIKTNGSHLDIVEEVFATNVLPRTYKLKSNFSIQNAFKYKTALPCK